MNHRLITPYRKMFVNEIFGHSHIAFDDDLIDSSYLAKKQQEIYDKYISKHNYHFIGKNALGSSVEYDHIHAALYQVLKEQDKCEIIDNDPIRYIRPARTTNDMSVVELESGRMFKAKLVIGNDGENSYTREAYNIESTSHSYNQKCIVRTLIHDQPLEGKLRIHSRYSIILCYRRFPKILSDRSYCFVTFMGMLLTTHLVSS